MTWMKRTESRLLVKCGIVEFNQFDIYVSAPFRVRQKGRNEPESDHGDWCCIDGRDWAGFYNIARMVDDTSHFFRLSLRLSLSTDLFFFLSLLSEAFISPRDSSRELPIPKIYISMLSPVWLILLGKRLTFFSSLRVDFPSKSVINSRPTILYV